MNSPDVLVVGAGIIGCSIAFELAGRRRTVEIVDHRAPGMGATHASAGMLAPYLEAHDGPLLDLTRRSLDLFDNFIANVCDVSGAHVEYARTGTLEVALHEAAIERLNQTATRLSSLGVSVTLLDARELRSAEPGVTADAVGGAVIDVHGFVSARDLLQATLAAAQARGVTLRQPARVERIRATGRGVCAETSNGPVNAETVVLAAGSWTGHVTIDGAVPAPVKPVRGQLLHLGWRGEPLRRVTWSERCYLVPWADGTLLVGATVEDAGFDEHTTLAGVRDLIEAVSELVPAAWTASLKGVEVGLRPGTGDELPIIGRSAVLQNVVYATGHYRNGILLAPLTARLVADVVTGVQGDPALAFTRPERFGQL